MLKPAEQFVIYAVQDSGANLNIRGDFPHVSNVQVTLLKHE
jgi:hypothetical protein